MNNAWFASDGALYLTAVIGAFGIAGAGFVLRAGSRLRKRRLLSAGGHGVTGITLLLAGALIAALAFNLHTYHRLTHERPAAELEFTQISPQLYRATVTFPESNKSERFDLHGDEWQIDARVLRWQGIANLVGLNAQFRIERLSGRYRDVEQERTDPRSVYGLATQAGLDVWALARRHERWLPWVDATYGSAAYLPMADRARYQVSVTQSGLIARPVNASGKTAVSGWN